MSSNHLAISVTWEHNGRAVDLFADNGFGVPRLSRGSQNVIILWAGCAAQR
jgi:hypothetical protein